jgi:phenylacetic acid degradation operon negative regulatory protein
VEAWDGGWRQAVVGGAARSAADRAGLRAAMASLRLAELRDGVWLRPDNLTGWPSGPAAEVVASQCRWLTAIPDDDPVELAAELWDLDGWARQARSLLLAVEALRPDLEGGATSALGPGFLRSAAVLRHLQADPLLPPQLLPPYWPGRALRDGYDAFDRAYRAVLAGWLQAAG